MKEKKNHTASSASPWNVIFCPCCIPFSTCTSRVFLSCTTFWPLHCPHLSFSLITSPARKNTTRTLSLYVWFHYKQDGTCLQEAGESNLQSASVTTAKEDKIPDPLQSAHTCCICWIILGPSWRIETFMPEPWHPAQRLDAPVFDPFLHKHHQNIHLSWLV